MTKQEKQERIANLEGQMEESQRAYNKLFAELDRVKAEREDGRVKGEVYHHVTSYGVGERMTQFKEGQRVLAEVPVLDPAEAMRGALETFVEWFWGKEGENANELFERIASEFKRDTGYLRPGKDGGMVEQPSYEERSAAWNEWVKAKHEAAEKLCRTVLATAREEQRE